MLCKRYISSLFQAFSAFALTLICLFALSACFGLPQPPQVAATVNGEIIEESTVTSFIEDFRKKNAQYETDSGWAEFLLSNGFTSESLRTYVINNVFIPQELIRQQCAQRGIQISDTELQKVIEQEKEFYEQRYGENSWDSVLASYGYDEKSWRENELNRLLEEQLSKEIIGEVHPSEAEIQAQANQNASSYNGKYSFYIEFPSEQDAQNALERLSGSDGKVSLEQFERLGNAQDAGWNSLPTTRDVMGIDYIQASNALDIDTVSEPININNAWYLIYCDKVFNVGAGGESVILRNIPQKIYDQIVADAAQVKADNLLNEWLDNLAMQSDITINPMPSGLPYNVSTTYVE